MYDLYNACNGFTYEVFCFDIRTRETEKFLTLSSLHKQSQCNDLSLTHHNGYCHRYFPKKFPSKLHNPIII